MKKKFKAILSYLIVFAMVISMLPAMPVRADGTDDGSESTGCVSIQPEGGTVTVKYTDGSEYTYNSGFGANFEGAKSVAEALSIESMSDPEFWAEREFDGWIIGTEQWDEEEGCVSFKQLENTGTMNTKDMLDFTLPEQEIFIKAQWVEDEDNYLCDVMFEGHGGIIIFTESYWDENDEPATQNLQQEDFAFRLEKREDATIGGQIKAQQDMELIQNPEKDGATFQGWLKFQDNVYTDEEGEVYSERIPLFETMEDVMSTEDVLRESVPEISIIYVAKWSDIELEDYLNSDDSDDDGSEEGPIHLVIATNGGEITISYNESDESPFSTMYAETNTFGNTTVKDAFNFNTFSGPTYWTERTFSGWQVQKQEWYDDEEEEPWYDWVPIEGVELLETEEMLAYPIKDESLRFEAKWEGNDDDYYSYISIDAYNGMLSGEWVYEEEAYPFEEMYMISASIRREEDTVENHLLEYKQARITDDPVKEGAEFEGWLKFIVNKTDEEYIRTLVEQEVSTEKMLEDVPDPSAYEIYYIAKWSDIPLDEYLNMDSDDDSDDNYNPNVLEVEYWYFNENGDYEYYPVAFDIDGVSTYGDFLKAAEKELPTHYKGMECVGWEYNGIENMNTVAKGGWIGGKALYKDNKTVVTVQFSYFDENGEATNDYEKVIIENNKTYLDVANEVIVKSENIKHFEDYSFTGEWRKNHLMNETISEEPYDYLIFDAVYESMPVEFIYSYLENGDVKTKSVEAKVSCTEPTLKLIEQNIPDEIDVTDIDTWVVFPDYEFTDWVSAKYNSVWVAAKYEDNNPVFHSRIKLTQEDGEYTDVQDENLVYVESETPTSEEEPNYATFEQELLDALYESDVKKVGDFELQNYAIHWANLDAQTSLAVKEENEFKYNYNIGAKFYVKAVYDKALIILNYPDGTVEKMVKDTGADYTLPLMHKGQQVYWDQGIAFAGGNPVLGGETVEVQSPYTSFTSIYRLIIKPLNSVPSDLGKTVDEVKTELESTAKKVLRNTTFTTNYLDVSLDRTDYEGGWNELDSSEFPSMGYSFYLPYPEGADKNDNFIITHMITSDTHPVYEKGQIEVLDYVAADEGLLVTLYSMSPVGISVAGCTHNWDAGTVTKAPTCKVEGEKLYTCKNGCGETKVEKIAVNSNNHSWDAGTVTKKASCDKDGTKTYTCTRCGKPKPETIKALGHKYKITKTTKATTKKNGKLAKQCTVCKTKATETLYRAKTVSLSKTSFVYNGKTQKPKVVVKDSKGKAISTSNYKVSYSKGCKNVGTYKVTVKLKGQYSGTLTKSFKITKAKPKITASNFTKVKGDKAFSIKPKISPKGGKVTYKTSNKKVATVSSKGKVTIKGKGKATITITSASSKNCSKVTKKITVTVKAK